MAKATVLACDNCGAWDSEANPVRRVTVAGPKFELCATDRAALLIGLGVPGDVARAYQMLVNDKIGKTGALPPLSAAVTMVQESRDVVVPGADQAASEPQGDLSAQGDPNGDPDQTDILTAIQEQSEVSADADTEGEGVDGPPSESDWETRLAAATAEIMEGLTSVSGLPRDADQDVNETPPKRARSRK